MIQFILNICSCFRFLGAVDKLGTAFADPVIATGYGAYLATPLLRKECESNKEMSKEQAKALITKVMQVLYYRDARSYPKASLFFNCNDFFFFYY